MSELSENYPWMIGTRYFGPAIIMEIEDSGIYIHVRVENDFETKEIRVRRAISSELQPGDNVLIMGDDPDNTYIIGILEQKEMKKSFKKSIILEGGTHAIQDEQSLKVLSRKRELLFEYDEKNGKAIINLESGDIEFITHNGNINFAASKDILLNGQAVGITSRSGAVFGSTDSEGNIDSSITVNNGELNLDSKSIRMRAEKGDLKIEDTTLTGNKINANIEFVKFIANRIESSAETIKNSAKNVYKTVEELYQIKTGRLRTIVKNTFYLKNKKAMLKSDDDFKVRAEKIHLG